MASPETKKAAAPVDQPAALTGAKRRKAPSQEEDKNKDGDQPSAPTGTKRKATLKEADKNKKAIRYHTPEQMYGTPTTQAIVKDVCAGCFGQRNEELKNDPIVLCDGKGCGREYHLQCCLPPLTLEEVPEGTYLCIDCDPDGTSSQLEQYFDNVWESRARFGTSREYVASLFDKDERIPVSEFLRMTEIHCDAIRGVRNLHAASVPKVPLGPDFLIGKPIRLYCPDGNSYHNGRIIDWRRATHLRPATSSSPSDVNDFQYGKLSEIACCEFLVAFPAGLDYRKRTIHQWLILEEHSLAVGTSLIWGFDTRKKDWSPGLIWLRTSMELLPILERLSEADGQVIFDASKIGQTKTWALTQVFGKENHLLLILREEAVDFFSSSFAERLSKRTETADGPRVDLSSLLACTEVEEQRRIRRWSRLPLHNLTHEKAITIADENMLPSLELKAYDSSEERDEIVVELGPRPCPLIRTGLDRIWMMKQLQSRQGIDQTKDAVADITVQGVKSRAAAIRQLQVQAKVGTSGV